MKSRRKLALAITVSLTAAVFLAVILYAALSPGVGHRKAEAEYQSIITELRQEIGYSEAIDCSTSTSSARGTGFWFEQIQQMECSFPAEYGQCTVLKDRLKSFFERRGYSIAPYGKANYLVKTNTSIGVLSDSICIAWEQVEPNAQTGSVKLSFEEKE